MSNMSIELRTIKNTDGTYNAVTFQDGKQVGDDLNVTNGDSNALAALYHKLRQRYPDDVDIKISGPAEFCIS